MFLNNIPPEILEPARLDGASTFRIFRQFVLPLSKPILITVGLFEAFSYWNIWYENLLYTDSNHSKLYTLQYVLYNMQKNASFISSNDSITGAMVTRVPTESFRMALVVVIILPILVTYPFFKRYFKKGLLSGSGK
ncbi:MAG: ABC transporter permease subunit [Lachnospiraceae bacterium]|nr:ABC transporter permease subunit [Lachnospiraceae bacterium]